ncbi:hypothetical protein ACMSI6_03710 [Pseudomonas antarctica]|uniref:hypothetical protein n=1 Tax=Pseudomonas antarctica TaxID=219572 RepID=UPI0039C00A01
MFVKYLKYGCGLVVLMLLSWLVFFLMSKPQDNPYMRLYSSVNGTGFPGCEFLNEKRPNVHFKFKLSAQECRFVFYGGGEGIKFYVDYQSSAVVFPRLEKGIQIYFFMTRISVGDYDASRHLVGKAPMSVSDGIELYDMDDYKERKFVGEDGVPVIASDFLATIRASRLYAPDFLVFYQYPKELTDVKAMDRFALDVLRKIVVE